MEASQHVVGVTCRLVCKQTKLCQARRSEAKPRFEQPLPTLGQAFTTPPRPCALDYLACCTYCAACRVDWQVALQSSSLIGSMGAPLSAPPAFGMMAPSPRQSCDGASMMQSAGYYVQQQQQSLHAPVVTAMATASAPAVGAFQQPFSSVNLMPSGRIEKGSLVRRRGPVMTPSPEP